MKIVTNKEMWLLHRYTKFQLDISSRLWGIAVWKVSGRSLNSRVSSSMLKKHRFRDFKARTLTWFKTTDNDKRNHARGDIITRVSSRSKITGFRGVISPVFCEYNLRKLAFWSSNRLVKNMFLNNVFLYFYYTSSYCRNPVEIENPVHWNLDLAKVSGVTYLTSSMTLDVTECKHFTLLLRNCSRFESAAALPTSSFKPIIREFCSPMQQIEIHQIATLADLLRRR